jgi:ribonucleotide reductase beta subunit family protein with ferritin-like domain
MLLFWRPNEIDVTKDRGDFKSLSDQEKFIFTKNLDIKFYLIVFNQEVFYICCMIVQI